MLNARVLREASLWDAGIAAKCAAANREDAVGEQ